MIIIALLLLVVDPVFQRRGVGKLIVQDGIDRAHASGYPLFVSVSPGGSLLYQSLGFELKGSPKITQAKVVQAMLVKKL
jgi:predicted N-acetyltransferase YhbS